MTLFIKKTIFLLLLIFSFTNLWAQSAAIQDLKIGDQCPDFAFENIINYSRTSAHLSDFKGRLVILDFWATWCGPCLKALPKLDSLQSSFGAKIMILPVSYQETELVKSYIKNSPDLKRLHLPYLTNDTKLGQYFRHNLIPHEVCIDGNGKVIAITEAEDITQKNLEVLLSGNASTVSIKKDIVDRDFKSPLLVGGLGKNYSFDKANLKYSSILTGYIPGLPSMDGAPNVYGDIAKIISTDTDIASLYQTALGTRSRYLKPPGFVIDPYMSLRQSQRTIWEVKDTMLRNKLYRWHGRSKQSWESIPMQQNTFCFELILPKSDSLKLNALALEDLNRFFGNTYGIIGQKEKRKVKCWALVITNRQRLTLSKGGKPDYTCDDNLKFLILKNYKISDFLFWWSTFEVYNSSIPIIDETHFYQSIDLNIKADPKNFDEVNAGLKKYGLEFREEERKIDMIVIKDKNN